MWGLPHSTHDVPPRQEVLGVYGEEATNSGEEWLDAREEIACCIVHEPGSEAGSGGRCPVATSPEGGCRHGAARDTSMKTQDFVCPECRQTVKAREYYPHSDNDYYYVGPTGVAKIKGYHWIEPYAHDGNEWPCRYSGRVYYVGDGTL